MYSKQSSVNWKSGYANPKTYGYKNILIPIINPTPATVIPQLFIDIPSNKESPIRFKQNITIFDTSSTPSNYSSLSNIECKKTNSYNTPYNLNYRSTQLSKPTL